MKTLSLPLAALSVFCLAFALTIPDSIHAQTAPKWAQDHLSAWYAAYNSGNAEEVTSLYASSAVILPPDEEELKGSDAIRASLSAEFQDTTHECIGDYDGFQVMGDLATAWGHDTCTLTAKSGGATEERKSRWLSVFHRHGEE